MRAIATSVVAASLLFLLPAPPAAACSCAGRTVPDSLRDADGVVVATRVLRPGEDPAPFASPDLRLRIDVRLKGAVPAFVTIQGDDGGSCQPYVQPQHVVALALTREPDGSWAAGGCSTIPVPAVLDAMTLPEPDGAGSATLLLTGDFPRGAHAVTVDDRGRVLAWGPGPGPASLVSVCPGGTASVEVSSVPGRETSVTARRLPGLQVAHTDTLPVGDAWPSALRCEAADARSATLVVSESDDVGRQHAVVLRREAGTWRTVARLAAQSVAALHGDHALVVAEDRPGREMSTWTSRLVTVDVGTGAVTEVTALGRFSAAELIMEPDGDVVVVGHPRDGGYERRVIELASGRERSRQVVADPHAPPVPLAHASVEIGDRVAWAGGRRLTITDHDGRVIAEGGPLALVATTAMASLADGPVDLDLVPPGDDELGATPPPAADDSALGAVTVDPPEGRPSPPWWLLATAPVALLAALIVVAVLLRRRRTPRRGTDPA